MRELKPRQQLLMTIRAHLVGNATTVPKELRGEFFEQRRMHWQNVVIVWHFACMQLMSRPNVGSGKNLWAEVAKEKRTDCDRMYTTPPGEGKSGFNLCFGRDLLRTQPSSIHAC
jgi:hypothetical protein